MADVFYHSDTKKLLEGKHLVFFGDSNTRAIYKDMVCLLNRNRLIDQRDLKRKQEPSYSGDKLGKHSELKQGRDYEEERSFQTGKTRVDFYFITKCYAPAVVDMMEDIHLGLREAPDVIYINSTFWDVCRWGPHGVTKFKDNVNHLARMFKSSLPSTTLVIWATALPVSHNVQSSLLIKQIDFLRHSLRFDVLEANQFAREVMVAHGFDILDNHFHMRLQIHRRGKDGVHYNPTAIRLLTNLLLTHIALSWDFPLPNRVETILLDKAKALSAPDKSSPTPELKTPQILRKESSKQKTLATKSQSCFDRRFKSKNTPKKKLFPKHRNNQHSYSVRQGLERPIRLKGGGPRNNWNSGGPSNKRSWRRSNSPLPPSPPPNMHSGLQVWENGMFPLGNYPPNNYPQTNWSEDHWPGEGRSFLGNDQRYNVEPTYMEEPRYSLEPRYPDNTRGPNNYGLASPNNNILAEALRQQKLLDKFKRQRYAPY